MKDDFSGDDKENELDGASWSCPYESFPFQIQACLLVVLCIQSMLSFLPYSFLSISRTWVVEELLEMVDGRLYIHRLCGSTQLIIQ